MKDPASHRNQSTGKTPGKILRLWQEGWVRIALVIVALCCVLAIPGLNLITRNQQGEGQIAARQLPIALQRLERSLGYSGLIHNFKNSILRPDEEVYYQRAVDNYETAVSTLTEIATLSSAIGREISFAELRNTLEEYRYNLEVARQAWREGATIAEVDELVRIPDEEATLDLQTIHAEVTAALQDWLSRDARRAQLQMAGLSAMLFLVAAGGAVFLIVTYAAEKERERQASELNARLASLGQLTSGIAHDVNNMLATIYYAVDLTLGDDLPETSRTFLNSAKRAIDRGRDLTARLLSFARPQPGSPETLLLSEVFANVQALAQPQLSKGIELEISIAKPGLTVHCDASQLENALVNLVLNSRDAIVHSGKGQRIRLTARLFARSDLKQSSRDSLTHANHSGNPGRQAMEKHESHFALIAVEDDGPGMPEEVRNRALEPFFTTKAAHSGTGLGLSIVYGFARASGGEMQIISTEGEGSSVRIILPRGTARQGPDPLGTAGNPARQETTTGASPRVFFVEDDESLRSVLSTALEKRGYEVMQAEDGATAMQRLEEGATFDLLLTDVVMPGGMDGFELAKQVRARRAQVPVLYLTGNAGPSIDPDVAVKAPVLRKPCPPDVLARAIAEALRVKPFGDEQTSS